MMLRFGLECAATKRYDTIVPRYLIFAILDVIDERDGDSSILEEDRIYVPAMKVLEGLASHPHHALDERVLRSLAVAFAAARGEYQRAYAQAEQIRFGLSFLKYGKELRKKERKKTGAFFCSD